MPRKGRKDIAIRNLSSKQRLAINKQRKNKRGWVDEILKTQKEQTNGEK